MTQTDGNDRFSTRLRETRLARKLDQAELGLRCGIPATSISHFEAGRRKPNLVNLRNLADALRVSVDYLLGRTENPEAHIDAAAFRHEDLRSERDRKILEGIEKLMAES